MVKSGNGYLHCACLLSVLQTRLAGAVDVKETALEKSLWRSSQSTVVTDNMAESGAAPRQLLSA